MARKKGIDVSTPSQFGVPHQNKYPVELAGNMRFDTTACPIADINTNTTFPMPRFAPASWGSLDHAEVEAGFCYESHTDGKKK